jgi:hypothetical protein
MGGRKVYGWGEKWPDACWVGERKERKGKQNKTKEKAGRLLVVGWGRTKRERERERKRKKRPAVYVAGWEKEKGGTEKKIK